MSNPRCPLCGHTTVEAFTVGDRNRGIGDERFTYLRCLTCRSYHLSDPPSDLGRYYPEAYYQLPDVVELDHHATAETPKLALLQALAPSGSLVDVGAGLGLFARAASTAGYDVTAIEMDGRCCEYLERVVGVRAIQSDAPEQALDDLGVVRVITLWHVLEHLSRPWDVLEVASERLEPGGVLVVATPNPEALQFRVLGTRWAHIDAPRHLVLVPFAALSDRVRELGLTVAQVTTADAAGRHWNRFGWEYALHGTPAHRAPTRGATALSLLIATLVAPIERRGMNGATYTAAFVKS